MISPIDLLISVPYLPGTGTKVGLCGTIFILMVQVFLKPGKEIPVLRFHPWVFSGAIAKISGQPEDGDLVEVLNKKGDVLGVGHFHHGSIAVRLLSFEKQDLQEQGFWDQKIQDALKTRSLIAAIQNDQAAFRLVHGEGDGLSGLIIDLYAGIAVVQCHSIGMHRQINLISTALQHILGHRLLAVYDKSKESLPNKYANEQSNGYVWKAENQPIKLPHPVLENGVRFLVNWETGQKTGFFLDQRDNRQLLSRFVADKTVFNGFCYTGGFSCYALKAGAKVVHSVDISSKAMDFCAGNVKLNEPFSGEHKGLTEDVLKHLNQSDFQYDVMIIDPPAFAKSMDKRHNAVQGYKRLNLAAMQRVKPGGVMFTFSCSQVVDRELFYHTVAAAAMELGRPVKVLHHLTQGADHPVSMFHPEGSYLKGLVLQIG